MKDKRNVFVLSRTFNTLYIIMFHEQALCGSGTKTEKDLYDEKK